jgi:hypothetical protein
MPSLTEGELDAAIKEGQAARAQRARAFGIEVREKGYFNRDDLRQLSVLSVTLFIHELLKPIDVVMPAPKAQKPPLVFAALSACGVSAMITMVALCAAMLGGLI